MARYSASLAGVGRDEERGYVQVKEKTKGERESMYILPGRIPKEL
jgi:hypothetical protein